MPGDDSSTGRAPPQGTGGVRVPRRLHGAVHEDLPGRRARGATAAAYRELFDDRDRVPRGVATTLALQRPRAVAGGVALQELGDVKGHVEALGRVEPWITDRRVVQFEVDLVQS